MGFADQDYNMIAIIEEIERDMESMESLTETKRALLAERLRWLLEVEQTNLLMSETRYNLILSLILKWNAKLEQAHG